MTGQTWCTMHLHSGRERRLDLNYLVPPRVRPLFERALRREFPEVRRFSWVCADNLFEPTKHVGRLRRPPPKKHGGQHQRWREFAEPSFLKPWSPGFHRGRHIFDRMYTPGQPL